MQGGTVFIVEDNIEVARMYERAFRLHGNTVLLAHDGVTALQELKHLQQVPAAIILDIRMPHMNGLDLLLNLRSEERFAKVPIAVLTNSFAKEDSERFLSSGADMYLVKIETQSKEIVEKVQELIRTRAVKN